MYRASPLPLFTTRRWVIAPYWANVDTRGTGQIFYRQTNDPNLLVKASSEIQAASPMYRNIMITNLFIATWDTVGYSPSQIDKVNYVLLLVKQCNAFINYVVVLLECLIIIPLVGYDKTMQIPYPYHCKKKFFVTSQLQISSCQGHLLI